MTKTILSNKTTAWDSWEIIVHTANIYNDYFEMFEKDNIGQVFHNRWELSLNKSKGLLKTMEAKD